MAVVLGPGGAEEATLSERDMLGLASGKVSREEAQRRVRLLATTQAWVTALTCFSECIRLNRCLHGKFHKIDLGGRTGVRGQDRVQTAERCRGPSPHTP